MCVKKPVFKMAGVSLVFGQSEVLKSSWERKQYSSTKKLDLDLNLQHKHFQVIEQFDAEIP